VLRAAQVVAVNDRDARRAGAELLRQLGDAPCGAVGIGRAEVAHDAHAVREAAREHGAQQVVQQRLVARVRLAAARQLGERQRALGQRLEDQHRRAAAGDQRLDHGRRRIGAVAREARRAADVQGLRVVHLVVSCKPM
jgi:hypothetical protein